MRYLLINYYRRANGQMDELVSVCKRVKPRDLQTAAVILDFKHRAVLKSTMDGITVPKDWQKIRDYYAQFYKDVIADLENGQP